METDVAYFARRGSEERFAASKATHELAAQSHLELAERFEELADAIKTRERDLGLRLAMAHAENALSA